MNTTTCTYNWWGNGQVQEETIAQPTVGSDRNGSNVATVTKQWFDQQGHVVWQKDALGTFTFNDYDSLTGRLDYTIQDIDSNTFGALQSAHPLDASLWLPSDLSLPTTGVHVNARTDYTYDALGRVTQTLGPKHIADVGGAPTSVRTATWTIYGDSVHETWTAQGYATETTLGNNVWSVCTLVGPVSITKTDLQGNVTDRIQATYASSTLSDLQTAISDFLSGGSDPFPISSFVSWTANNYSHTRLVATAVYSNFSGISINPSWTYARLGGASPWGASASSPATLFLGSSANYTVTTYGYEDNLGGVVNGQEQSNNVPNYMGRQNKTVAPDGTITRYVYDANGDVIETWMGTNDIGATDADPTGKTGPNHNSNNMVEVSSSDARDSGGNMISTGYDADGNLLSTTQYVDSSPSDDRTTYYQYDWRDRLTGTLNAAGVATIDTLDNLGETTDIQTYSGASMSGGQIEYAAADLLAWTHSSYDALGRVYQTAQYAVQQGTGYVEHATGGATGTALAVVTNTWYDPAGNVLKTETSGTMSGTGTSTAVDGAFQEYAYDPLGRLVGQYTGYGNQTISDLYDTSTGYAQSPQVSLADDTVVEEMRTQYDAAGNTLFVTDYQLLPQFQGSATGVLEGVGAEARVTYTADWYDGIERPVVAADYGTNGGTAVSWTDTPPTQSALAGAPLVTDTAYNSAGEAWKTTDPKGLISESFYDAAGRVVKTVQDYVDGNPATGAADQDVTVDYVYTPGGQQQMMVAENQNLQNTATSVSSGTVPFSCASVAAGTGYLMYSAQNVQSRFGVSGSGSFVVVVWTGSQWEYDNGTTLTTFNPLPTDLLVASVSFGSATAPAMVSASYGTPDILHGIESGYTGSTNGLSFSGLIGSITVGGTSFVPYVLDQVTTYVYARSRFGQERSPATAEAGIGS